MLTVVVAAALVDRSGTAPRVLLGRRRHPPALAGCWEFPGGKVEPGESEAAALRRECREELGVEIALARRLGGDLVLPGGAVLRVWAGHVTARLDAPPGPGPHSELRWVAADELDALDWIPADRPLLGPLRELLGA